jgi:23S rRNA pseudouridine1911/1915/1917 synthase
MSTKRSRPSAVKPPHTPQVKPRISTPQGAPDATWTVPAELGGKPLDGVVRTLAEVPWSLARRWIESGKIAVNGEPWTNQTKYISAGAVITRHPRAPSAKAIRAAEVHDELIEYVDGSVVVVRKPAGISTVPFGDEAPDDREPTLDAIVREVLAKRDHLRGRAPLGVVQRLDKATSGLLVFARSFAAKKHLGLQLRNHSMRRVYLAIAHGDVPKKTFRSRLVENRGDGIRGSLRPDERAVEGQIAITHVEPIERLVGATLVACRLETGRTHQIRIHLSEAGHPIVGDLVYVRKFQGEIIKAPRLMLHAKELGFVHPRTNEMTVFQQEPPPDFQAVLAKLRSL